MNATLLALKRESVINRGLDTEPTPSNA
jgi:hypothetical protein